MYVHLYARHMEEISAGIVVKLELAQPVEIGNFVSAFAGLGAQFERFIRTEHPDLEGQVKVYVEEVRKGSLVAELIPLVFNTMVTTMDQLQIVTGFVKATARALGSSVIDRQSQNRTVAARATAERKTLGHLSYRVATLRQSFSRPNMISICHLAAHVYMREKAVSALVPALVVFHGLAARLPAWDAWLYPFVFQCFSEPVGVVAAVRCPAMVCLQTMRGGQQPFCRWQAVHKGCRASAIADPLPGRRCVHRREGDLRS